MEALDQIKALAQWGPNPSLLTLVFCMGLGNTLKRARCFKNEKIPLVLGVAGGCFFPALSWSLDKDYLSRAIPYNFVIGIIIGWAAVGAHQWFIKTFPRLAWMIPKSEDTSIISKTEVSVLPPQEDK